MSASSEAPGPPPRGFPVEEYRDRCVRAQASMADIGFDALLLTTEPEVRYFTGFLTPFWQSPTRPWFLIVPREGKPVAVVPSIGAALMADTWIDDVRDWPSPRPEDEGVSLLAKTLQQLAGPRARIGLPEGAETHLRMPLADWHRLRAALPDTTFADATMLLRTLRALKSPAEIAKIAYICTIVSEAFDVLPRRLSPGAVEAEIFRAFRIACLERGADDVPYLVGGGGTDGLTNVITPATTRVLQRGDLFMLDVGATFDGYFCDFDRTFAVGTASPAAEHAYDVLYAATEAGFAAAQPGASCRDVFQAMQHELATGGAGDSAVGRLGHGLGMQLTEWPSQTADNDTEIRPGMVLTLEPAMEVVPGRVMVQEEDIVVTETGPRYLTRRAPSRLPVAGG